MDFNDSQRATVSRRARFSRITAKHLPLPGFHVHDASSGESKKCPIAELLFKLLSDMLEEPLSLALLSGEPGNVLVQLFLAPPRSMVLPALVSSCCLSRASACNRAARSISSASCRALLPAGHCPVRYAPDSHSRNPLSSAGSHNPAQWQSPCIWHTGHNTHVWIAGATSSPEDAPAPGDTVRGSRNFRRIKSNCSSFRSSI